MGLHGPLYCYDVSSARGGEGEKHGGRVHRPLCLLYIILHVFGIIPITSDAAITVSVTAQGSIG